MDTITIITPQFERTQPLSSDFKPTTNEDFLDFVNNAPIDALKAVGFGKWSTMNSMIKENNDRRVGYKDNLPTELLEHDEAVYLFPKEWYNLIPEGFAMTDISGREHKFKRGKTDDDIRFGCIAYGIRRKV